MADGKGRRGRPGPMRSWRAGPGSRREWVGGIVQGPAFVMDREEPYRPDMVIWMELPAGLVVGSEVVAPEDRPGSVGRVLATALQHPLAGPVRRPDALRVGDPALLDEVREIAGEGIPVSVGPTPELDEFLDAMMEGMSREEEKEPSYLEEGRVRPETVEELFEAARLLYRIAPWKVASDDQVLRMDIPALDVHGACLSIIGMMGISTGLLIFPSLDGYLAFAEAGTEHLDPGGRMDLGTDWLALSFKSEDELPPTMRSEVAAHDWPVAGPDAFPGVQRVDRDGVLRPLTEKDLRIVTACATSLTAFFAYHRGLFEQMQIEPVCESFFDYEDVEVRFTAPYEAFQLFDVSGPTETVREPADRSDRKQLNHSRVGGSRVGRNRADRYRIAHDSAGRDQADRERVGRNDPCPCGSGRKYKNCHLKIDEQEGATERERHSLHDLDNRLLADLVKYAVQRFGHEFHAAWEDFTDPQEDSQLVDPWSVYGFALQGRSAADWYLEEHAGRLDSRERGWLEAQRSAWLSVWEVTAVEAGRSLTLRDLLSEQIRRVEESSGSQSLVLRDAILGRVVDHEGVSLLCGVHSRQLPPREASEVVRRARGRLRRRRAVPVERLAAPEFGRYLIRRWEEAVEALHARISTRPVLQNTDGDPLLLTTDHFEVAPGKQEPIERRFAEWTDVDAPEPGAEDPDYVFLRSKNRKHPELESTVVGRALFSEGMLLLETNSLNRADALRKRVEAAVGEHLRHRERTHLDPFEAMPEGGSIPPEAPDFTEPASPDVEAFTRELKQRHYADWIDQPLPALGGKTPRETAQSVRGRADVDQLLKEMENMEQRLPEGSRFDFSEIRRTLGI